MKKKNDTQNAQGTQSTDEKSGGTQSTEKKMTIFEYEDKYVKQQNTKNTSFLVRILATVIGVFLFTCLLLVALKFFDIHLYAGIAASVVCVILYIFLFIVPIVKIFKTDYFVTNVNSQGAAKAKKHNKKVRRNIAEKIIDFNASVDGPGWYDDKTVIEMAACLNKGDDEGVKAALTKLYKGSVKSSARSLIVKSSVKSGILSAISQSNLADAAIIAVINLQLVKDIVFLYGFRPSDAKLSKIFGKVVQNSLAAYGLGSVNIGQGVAKTIGGVVTSIPILGSAISTLIDSSVQGLANGVLTTIIGFQTISYLNKEYKLQDILDGIDVSESEEEIAETCEEVKKGIREETGRKKTKQPA